MASDSAKLTPGQRVRILRFGSGYVWGTVDFVDPGGRIVKVHVKGTYHGSKVYTADELEDAVTWSVRNRREHNERRRRLRASGQQRKRMASMKADLELELATEKPEVLHEAKAVMGEILAGRYRIDCGTFQTRAGALSVALVAALADVAMTEIHEAIIERRGA